MGLLDTFQDWLDRRRAMKEIREIKRDAKPYELLEKSRLLQTMREAGIQENPELAWRAWQQLNVMDRDMAISSETALNVLIGLKLYDLAEEISAAAVQRFPTSPEVAEHYAKAAQFRGDLEAAAQRWEQVRRRFPTRLQPYVHGGSCLKWLDRTDEADQLLAAAVAMEPEDLFCSMEFASVAEHVKNWDKALIRWTYVREHFHKPIGWIQSAACLRELGRDSEAAELLTRARFLFEGEPAILNELGHIALRRRDWSEALRFWEILRDAFPRNSMGYFGAAWTYRDMGEHDKADEIIESGLNRVEADTGLYIEYARLAHNRGKWDEAIRRWNLIQQRFPERAEGYDGASAALASSSRSNEAAHCKNSPV